MVRINFAEVEELGKLERGRYVFSITDTDVKETGDEAKHPNSEYWRLELTVQEGPKAGQKEWMNIFLPPYEPKVLKTLLRVTVGQHEWSEEDIDGGEFDVEQEDLLNLTFSALVKPQKNNDDFNDVGSLKTVDEVDSNSDMLP